MSLRTALLALALCGAPIAHAAETPAVDVAAAQRVRPGLEAALARLDLRFGAPVLVRVFKQQGELELWVDDGTRFRLFRTYPICHWSGTLGPKAWEGDRQAPEGFYRVDRGALRVRAQYHLGFDLGYPNEYDRAHGRDGDYLLVHGACYSIGCYAMGNAAIEEIYTLVDAALTAGQAHVDVHAFPFRYEQPPRPDWRKLGWGGFWAELEPAYHAFNRTGRAPTIRVVDGHYVVAPATAANDEARRSGPRTGHSR